MAALAVAVSGLLVLPTLAGDDIRLQLSSVLQVESSFAIPESAAEEFRSLFLSMNCAAFQKIISDIGFFFCGPRGFR